MRYGGTIRFLLPCAPWNMKANAGYAIIRRAAGDAGPGLITTAAAIIWQKISGVCTSHLKGKQMSRLTDGKAIADML